MTATIGRDAIRNLLIAAATVLAGLAAARLPSPVAGLPAIDPGAGIALVALLVGGWRLLPGVVAGTLTLAALDYGLGAVAPALAGIPAALAVTLAVVAQSTLAATLARRWPSRAVAADQPWNEFALLLLGVLAAALDAAVHAGLFVAAGDARAGLAFFVTWMGDAVGVLVLTPLALATAFRRDPLWRVRRLDTLLPALIALAGVLAVSLLVSSHEQRRVQDAFARDVYEVDVEMQRQFIVYRRVVLSIDRFWQASQDVERDEFRRFVMPVLREFPALKAVEWVPLVPAAQRNRYERAARADGLGGFAFRERGRNGTLVPEVERASYLPVFYVEPLAGNEPVLGLDIGAIADRHAVLARARDRDAPTGSPPVTLLQDPQQHNGLLITKAVFDHRQVPSGGAFPLLGYAVSVFHIDVMLDELARHAARSRLAFAITDTTDGTPLPVYVMAGGLPSAPQLSREFDFGGRHWQIDYAPSPGRETRERALTPWLTLIGGCLLVGLLQALLLEFSGQASRTQREVEYRTRELRRLAALSEALQAAPTYDAAQEAIARAAPQLFEGTRGGLSLRGADGTTENELVQWGGASNGVGRIDVPLREGEQQYGSLWLEPDDSREAGEEWREPDNVKSVAQAIHLALANLRLRETLRDQATRDPLTGLYNRRHLAEVFAHETARARRSNRPFCLALLDIDHFKRVNDTYGHDAGDAVLQALAQYLRENLRSVDLCFRLGGEEFALLLPYTALDAGVLSVDKVRSGFGQRAFVFGAHPEYRPTFSAGVVEVPRDGDRLDELLRIADTALYRAKQNGRNQVLRGRD